MRSLTNKAQAKLLSRCYVLEESLSIASTSSFYQQLEYSSDAKGSKKTKTDQGEKSCHSFWWRSMCLLKTGAHQVGCPGDLSRDREHHHYRKEHLSTKDLHWKWFWPKREDCSKQPCAGIGQTGHRLLYRRKKPILGWAGRQSSPTGNFTSLFSPCHQPLLLNTWSATDACRMTRRDHDSAVQKCAPEMSQSTSGVRETLGANNPAQPQQVCPEASLWTGTEEGDWRRERGHGCLGSKELSPAWRTSSLCHVLRHTLLGIYHSALLGINKKGRDAEKRSPHRGHGQSGDGLKAATTREDILATPAG